jgi:hypothetical protein
LPFVTNKDEAARKSSTDAHHGTPPPKIEDSPDRGEQPDVRPGDGDATQDFEKLDAPFCRSGRHAHRFFARGKTV